MGVLNCAVRFASRDARTKRNCREGVTGSGRIGLVAFVRLFLALRVTDGVGLEGAHLSGRFE